MGEILELITMSHDHMNFVGQRADKILVDDVIVEEGIVLKDIHEYTVKCPECDCPGYYDERGDIICNSCGMVLGGEPVLPTEHGTGDDENESNEMDPSSRGLGTTEVPPIPEPATEEEYYARE